MLYLCSYEWIKQTLGGTTTNGNANDTSFLIHFGGGDASAEAIACIVYVPVDVLKDVNSDVQ
jgi:hypothetical protein